MKRIRIIPVLLLYNGGFYKTIRFKNPRYLGDPINTVKLFNEKGADEVVVLDISATRQNQPIPLQKIREIAGEAFMPMAYGGGIKSLADAQSVLDAGYEKVVINTSAIENPGLVTEIANVFGSQSVVVSLDVGRTWLGAQKVYGRAGTRNSGKSPTQFAAEMESRGAGELIVNAIYRDGTWEGYDLELIKSVASTVKVPVVACGGAASMQDFRQAVLEARASAVAAGSMFVYQKKGMGVLISFPEASLKL